jgi:ABC-2 type transport system permease protein
MVVFSVTLFVSLMLIFGGVPANFPDLLLRLCAYVFLFYLNSAFTVSVVMLFGIVFKDKLVALVVSASYVFIEWASPAPIIPDSFGDLRLINPSYIYQVTLLNPGNTGIKLFDSFDYTSSTLVSWLGASWLYLILMMAEVVIVILVCCMIYIREEG